MVSAQPMDGSILDRIERCFEFHSMDWKDEEPIVKAKFPILAARAPGIFPKMGKATKALRAAIDNNDLHAEFSHRGLCSILGHAQDLLVCSGGKGVPKRLLKEAAKAWWSKLPDTETRKQAQACIDPHIKGGIIDEGDKSHIGKDPLAAF